METQATSAVRKEDDKIGSYQITEKPVLSARVKRVKESFFETEVKASVERVKFLLEAYQEARGDMPILIRARVLDKYLRGMTLYIDENPIVGGLTQYRRGVNPFPEYDAAGTKFFSLFGDVGLNPEEKEVLIRADDYFRDNTQAARAGKIFQDLTGVDRLDLILHGVSWDVAGVPLALVDLDYGKALNKGLEGIIREAEQELVRLNPMHYEDFKKRDFYRAVIVSLSAVIAWANRYASLAEKMAEEEADAEKKTALQRIAETCRWVPEKPARSFYEAIQSFWFIHAAAWIEQPLVAIAPGRFPQYTYSFYKKDRQEGKITEEEAIELLELLCIKFSEIGVQLSSEMYKTGQQQHTAQSIALGGFTRDGKDATNEIDFLFLEAEKRVRMIAPSTVVVWHEKLSSDFLMKCADVVRMGLGKPAFINGHTAVERNLERWKCSLEDAYDFAVVGCSQSSVVHATDNAWGGGICLPKILELTLHNGRDPRTGKQLGLQTGGAESFKTYEELDEAMRKQVRYFTGLVRNVSRISENVHGEYFPTPFASALLDDCIKRGKHSLDGGTKFGGDSDGILGVVDAANSLAAIKKVVFEEKRITMGELLETLQSNFEGHEEAQRLLRAAPKYGNEDPYVDKIVRSWYDEFYKEELSYTNHLGQDDARPYAVVVAGHSWFGQHLGAQPSGREAGKATTDGTVSATPGTDRKGPTALIHSAVEAIDPKKYNGDIFNMKFHPSALANDEAKRKLLALIKIYLDLGGYHIQFNVVDAKFLKEAQLHPDQYRDLVVRVAGYSAFFVTLDPRLQEEIIARTEYTWS